MVYITITLYQRPSGWFWFRPTDDQPQIVWSSSMVRLAEEALNWATKHYGTQLGQPVNFTITRL